MFVYCAAEDEWKYLSWKEVSLIATLYVIFFYEMSVDGMSISW